MSEAVRVIQKDVQLGDITIDGLQLPDGRIGTSFASFGKTIEKTSQQAIAWLTGNSDEAVTARNLLTRECGFNGSQNLGANSSKLLSQAGLTDHILPLIQIEGSKTRARFVPDPHLLLPLYWRYWDGKGNVKAKALLVATSAETIERRLDAAFEIQRTEQERNERLKKNISWIEGVDYVFTINTSQGEFKRLENSAATLGIFASDIKPVRIKTRAGMQAVIEYARTDLGVESLSQSEMEALAASGVVKG